MNKKLIPVDKNQCQVEKPNTNFMSFGGRLVNRCTNKPDVIVYEQNKRANGLKGSMSMCQDCLKKFIELVGLKGYIVKSINAEGEDCKSREQYREKTLKRIK